ncbi:phosphatase PAP2 family protein [Paenibacillus sp. SYP-B3998]|uniref:Phosphatase PAP2 family protein n=1 Tax=Paenibacillus sp. SYP-B3998 TaxID=2678564 RepID=A0A6G3ZXT8_9BACL|nr:phosphatase PAP2 family protein [Paenibacillus sp. SYP-B3998]NEW06925.1 phosphatase PAP2 family protein [Paenibacillus sp. SYP-B3998]
MKTEDEVTLVENGEVYRKRLYKDLFWGAAMAIILLMGFIVLSKSLSSSWLERLDITIGQAIRSIRSEGLTQIAIFFTILGKLITESVLFLVAAAWLLFKYKIRWETLILFAGAAGAWVLNALLKMIFERVRPLEEWLIQAEGFSFPSGHAMVASLFYGLIGYLLWVNIRNSWKGAWCVPVITIFVILCIGISRIYLGVHYPSDVLAGFAAGSAGLIGCIMGIQAIQYKQIKQSKA